MRRIIKYIFGFVLLAALLAGIFVIVRLNKSYPEENTYSDYMITITEDGMYYIKYNMLMFFDNSSGKDTVVCNKANCKHNTETCNAYIASPSGDIMVYDDRVYISYFDYEIMAKDGELEQEGGAYLISVGKDGEGRKVIYSSDNGAVLSMQGMDGVIYFTSYSSPDGFVMNEYKYDCSLYAYDLRWNKLKLINTYKAGEECDNSSLYIIGSPEKDKLYLNYGYYPKDGLRRDSFQKFDVKSNNITELREFKGEWMKQCITSDKKYIIYNRYAKDAEGETEDSVILMECDEGFQDVRELLSADDARIDCLNGYMYIIKSDYNKVLYDYNEDKYYVANTAFTEEGTYISDIYDIDKEHNLVYIDATDYTGYMPGDILPGDISSNAVLKWDVFLSEFFIPYEELSEEQKNQLSWLKVY